jgi:arylsulfatase A-like enzyme
MQFVKYFISVLIGFFLIPESDKKQSENQNRPNIIFILSDDHTTNAISSYGSIYSNIAPTPNIDKIANEGAILKNVFATNSICGPSRASILTGTYSNVNGYYKNYKGGVFDNSQWTFPKELQKSGYNTALVGKWHLASKPKGFNYYKYHISRGQQGFYWDPVYNENGIEIKEKGYATNLTTDYAIDWLENRDKKDPFCLLLQYKAPHREWQPDSKYEKLWENIELPYPNTFDDDYTTRELTAGNTEMTMDYFCREDMKMIPPKNLTQVEKRKWLSYGFKRNETVIVDSELSEIENRKAKFQIYIKDYLATIKSVDDNIGRVLDYLEENNLSKNTIIVYASDQGFFIGEHGWFDKRFMYEESIRMPFVIKYPGLIKPGTINKDIITNIDFAPTILEMLGLQAPKSVQGKSFFSNLTVGKNKTWRQSMYYHYYEYPFYHHVQPHYGIRNERYKLIHFYYNIDQWELYDLKKDPDELNNMYPSKKESKLVSKLKSELYSLKKYYGNELTYEEMRNISNTDFGGLESKKPKQ